MVAFYYDTVEDIKGMRFGECLLDIIKTLQLRMSSIKGSELRKMHKEGCWAIEVIQPGCSKSEPKTEAIVLNVTSDSKEKGLSIRLQELIGRLCGRHHEEVEGHYIKLFGRRDEKGVPIKLTPEERKKCKRRRIQYQDLESHINDLQKGSCLEIMRNDELCALVKEKDEKIKELEEKIKSLGGELTAQDKKFANQEQRVQDKNKRIREQSLVLAKNEMEFKNLATMLKDLRAAKRSLEEKITPVNMGSSLIKKLQKEKKELQERLEAATHELQEVKELQERLEAATPEPEEVKELQEKLKATTKDLELYKSLLEKEGFIIKDEEVDDE